MIETIHAIAIECPATVLKREARAAHEVWLNDATEGSKYTYATALLRWARAARNTFAARHAIRLLRGEE